MQFGPRPLLGPASGHLVGESVPAFRGPDTHGALVTETSLRVGTTLLAFVPFAFTGVCGDELGELHEASAPGGPLAGVRILAVSCDPMPSQRAWRAERGFGFDLVSDFWPHGRIASAFGIFDEQEGRADRGSFLIDAGIVRWSLLHPPGIPRSVSEYVRALEQLGVGGAATSSPSEGVR